MDEKKKFIKLVKIVLIVAAVLGFVGFGIGLMSSGEKENTEVIKVVNTPVDSIPQLDSII